MPLTQPAPNATQKPAQRILAHFIRAIYTAVSALRPVIDGLQADRARPWQQRTHLAARFNAILTALLALTARITPATFSRPPPNLRPRPERPHPERPHPERSHPNPQQSMNERRAAPKPGTHPLPTLSARQLAACLLRLLQRLDRLAADAAATLPPRFNRAVARASTLADRNAHRPPYPSWERTG